MSPLLCVMIFAQLTRVPNTDNQTDITTQRATSVAIGRTYAVRNGNLQNRRTLQVGTVIEVLFIQLFCKVILDC